MSKRAASNPGVIPYIPFDPASAVPLYLQIYEGYREAIITGRIPGGQRLPSSRAQASALRISRFPVLSAFEALLREGYAEGKAGSGTFVCDHIPEDLTSPQRLARPIPRRRPGDGARVADDSPVREAGPFAVGVPALDRFPRDIWARLIRRHASIPPSELAGGDPAGYQPLRAAIAEYLRVARAVDCEARQVIIVSGSQMGLRVAARALTVPNSAVCVEDPSYIGVQRGLRMSASEVIPVSVDRDGMDIAKLVQLGARVRMAFVTPAHQYPLGVSMSVARRRELLTWAANNHAWIIEDDYGSEFRYAGRSLGALQGMGVTSRIVYVGTFSNVLFPALCLGYMVVPSELVKRCLAIRAHVERNSPILPQRVLTDFLTEGHMVRHLRRMGTVYHSRRDALIAALHKHAADQLSVGNTDAGQHLVVFLPDEVDDQEIVRQAVLRGLSPSALSNCYARPNSRRGLVLGFGGSDEAAIADGVEVLARLISTHARDTGTAIRAPSS